MLQKSSMWLAAEQFFLHPTKEHCLTSISRNTKIAHTSTKKNLDKLAKAGIIKKSIESKGSRKFPTYKADLNSKEYKKQKQIYNLSKILDSGIADFLEKNLMPKAIVLFGSYLRGEDTEESDIDLFLECRQDEIDLKRFEKLLGRKLQLHFNENFKTYSKELKNNIINGFLLSGFLEGY
ncbi:MAG: nucleotidyltransferase domain-containing protein [Candidatus Woesearchaeota archaeon]